jgi:hypothetical protein
MVAWYQLMKKLTLQLVILGAIFSVALIVVRVVGSEQEDSKAVRILGLKSCDLPCVMGVTLGKTTFAAAKRILTSYRVPNNYKISMVDGVEKTSKESYIMVTLIDPAGQSIEIRFFFVGQDKVRVITFGKSKAYSELLPSVADLVLIYGIPECVTIDGGSGGSHISMPVQDKAGAWSIDFAVEVVRGIYKGYDDTQPMSWHQPVNRVSFLSHLDKPFYYDHCGRCSWKGISHNSHDLFLSCVD